MKKRCFITAILAIVICFSLFPAPAHAAAVMKTGTCGNQGDNLTWTLDDTGLLTISGTGEMASYDEGDARWYPYWESITAVVIEDGVTSIGQQVFENCANITTVTIPQTVTEIGHRAFNGCSSLLFVVIPDSDRHRCCRCVFPGRGIRFRSSYNDDRPNGTRSGQL